MRPFRLVPMGFALAFCLGAVPAMGAGVEIVPDPALHMPEARTLTVGAGASANVWRVFEANTAHYRHEGRIIWLVSPLKNPIPKAARGEARWYRDQVRGLLRAIGQPEPKKISVSTQFARSSVVADLTPFRANLYVQFPDGREIVDVIYVETISKGAGRLVVMQLPTHERPALEAASDFAKRWGARLKDVPAESWK